MKQSNNETMESTHFESLYPSDSRFNEVKKIFDYVKEGNSCQIIGIPGVGKSNLLRMLAYNRNVRIKHVGENQKWFHFVLINCSEIKDKNLQDATKLIFLSLADSLRDRRFTEEHNVVHAIFEKHFGFNDELVLFQGLKEAIHFLTIEKELTVVFLFDRFEDCIPTLTSEFFAHLRILRNQAKYRFSVVFSVNKPLEDLIEPSIMSDFYEFIAGNQIYLPVADEPSLKFRIEYLQKTTGKTIDKKLINAVIEQTAGHGKLTRLSLEAIINMNYESGSMNHELASLLIEQKSVKSSLLEIWRSLSPSDQTSLTNPNQPNLYLERVGLLNNGKITIPLLASFVKNNLPADEAGGAIVYNPVSNDILKGSLSISNLFTASEFKLLKFFLMNKDRIVEREEIITAVWQDTKSTAGVTDQALDQLIFRVRKKIEKDPNNPKHIETVKGRGFKFTPHQTGAGFTP